MCQKSLETRCFHKLLPDRNYQCQDSLTQVFVLSCVGKIFQKLGIFKAYSAWDLYQGAMKPSSDELNSQNIPLKNVHFCQRYMSVFIIYVKLSYKISPSRNGNIYLKLKNSTVLAIAWNFICIFKSSFGVVFRKQQICFLLLCFISHVQHCRI